MVGDKSFWLLIIQMFVTARKFQSDQCKARSLFVVAQILSKHVYEQNIHPLSD